MSSRVANDLDKELMKQICGTCSLSECDGRNFQFHHINGNHGDDNINNLVPLCALHHDLAQRELSIIKAREISQKLEEPISKITNEEVKEVLINLKQELYNCGCVLTNSQYKPEDIKRARAIKANDYRHKHPQIESQILEADGKICLSKADRENVVLNKICKEWEEW